MSHSDLASARTTVAERQRGRAVYYVYYAGRQEWGSKSLTNLEGLWLYSGLQDLPEAQENSDTLDIPFPLHITLPNSHSLMSTSIFSSPSLCRRAIMRFIYTMGVPVLLCTFLPGHLWSIFL